MKSPQDGRLAYGAGACLIFLAGSALTGQQTQFQGSVPAGAASPTPLAPTLRDAIGRGLRTNLGLPRSGPRAKPQLNIQPVRFVAARHYSLWTRLPFFLAGGLKIAYDLILYKEFVSHRPPEEA
jgi:hypothetical protein